MSHSLWRRANATDGNRKWSVILFTLSSHQHIYIAKYHFTIRDDYFENPGENAVLACEKFTSSFRPWPGAYE